MWLVAIVAVFVLAAMLIVSLSPTPMRIKLARFLGLEIEGGGPRATDGDGVAESVDDNGDGHEIETG